MNNIREQLLNSSVRSKLETIIMSLSLLFVLVKSEDIIDAFNFNMDQYLIDRCGEICKETKDKIDTLDMQPISGLVSTNYDTVALTHEGPIDLTHSYFPHGCKRNVVLEQTRHEYAFANTGKALGTESLETGQETFNISYPGIGAHVAILTLLKEMTNVNPAIKSINVYTPELIEGYRIIDSFLIYLNETGYLDDYQYESFELDNTTEVFMNFQLGKTAINMHYHVDPNRDKFIYADETNFDLIVLHDLGRGSTEMFMRQLHNISTTNMRILGPRLSSQIKGIKTTDATYIGGACHCEHTCQNRKYYTFFENGDYSATVFTMIPNQ